MKRDDIHLYILRGLQAGTKKHQYVKLQGYVEVYDIGQIMLPYSGISGAGDRLAQKSLCIQKRSIMYKRMMSCGAYGHAAVYFVTIVVPTKLSGLRYRVTWIGQPDRQARLKTSSCVKSYESVEVIGENARLVAINLIINS